MNIVAIGGGTGLTAVLRGLKAHVASPGRPPRALPSVARLTAVVTVTDEGGSSGRLRREFRILPPGDIRNCLVALAEDEHLLAQIFNYRFTSGRGLRGHNLGNLFLTALTHLKRDFAKAVRATSEVLAVQGEIFPATLADVRLRARLRTGRMIDGELSINRTRVPIERLQLVPANCRPLPETLDAIEQADLVTVGPGSLFTSLVPNLLVRGIPEQIRRSRAVKVFICNLMTQPGESRDYSAAEHLETLHAHAGHKLFDFAILNSDPIPRRLLQRYAAERAAPVRNDLAAIHALGVKPVTAHLLQTAGVARHNPLGLAKMLLDIASGGRSRHA